MVNYLNQSRSIAIWAVAVPFGLFAAYVARLVVPEVLRVVVPTVVERVLTN
jgi:hypothetical protein